MTDEQYSNLMDQMRDLGMMIYGSPGDTKLLTTMMERLHRRADDAAPVTTLDQGKVGHKYVITRINFSDPYAEFLAKDLTVGTLVEITGSITGDSIETNYGAIRLRNAKAFSVMKFPEDQL